MSFFIRSNLPPEKQKQVARLYLSTFFVGAGVAAICVLNGLRSLGILSTIITGIAEQYNIPQNAVEDQQRILIQNLWYFGVSVFGLTVAAYTMSNVLSRVYKERYRVIDKDESK